MMDNIDELKKKLKEAEKQQAQEKYRQNLTYSQQLLGRCYKSIDSVGRYSQSQRVNTDHGIFIKILGILDKKNASNNNNIELACHRLDICCTPVGWVRNNNGLRYQMNQNYGSMTKTKRKITDDVLQTGNLHGWSQITLKEGNENGSVLYPDYGLPFVEIPEEEMSWVEDNLAEMSKLWYERFRNLFTAATGVTQPITPETEGIISAFDPATLKSINDLIKANPSLDLTSLTQISKRVARYNYFNNFTLPELVQYNIDGDKGLYLEIKGGDGGTDYEPYVTHYYIQSVHIDWKHILYPIRQHLSCLVLELVEKLENLSSVYEPASWECLYDTFGYDAIFTEARLKQCILKEVNSLITQHIRA